MVTWHVRDRAPVLQYPLLYAVHCFEVSIGASLHAWVMYTGLLNLIRGKSGQDSVSRCCVEQGLPTQGGRPSPTQGSFSLSEAG